jgi:hypothetical protein
VVGVATVAVVEDVEIAERFGGEVGIGAVIVEYAVGWDVVVESEVVEREEPSEHSFLVFAAAGVACACAFVRFDRGTVGSPVGIVGYSVVESPQSFWSGICNNVIK